MAALLAMGSSQQLQKTLSWLSCPNEPQNSRAGQDRGRRGQLVLTVKIQSVPLSKTLLPLTASSKDHPSQLWTRPSVPEVRERLTPTCAELHPLPGARRCRGLASGGTRGQPRSPPRSVLTLRVPLGWETPLEPPELVATPNLHQKTRQASEKETSDPHRCRFPVLPPLPSGPTVLSARHPRGASGVGRREIRAYGFICQSAAAGHTSMGSTRCAPAALRPLAAHRRHPPSRPADGWGAGWGPRLPAIGLSDCRSGQAGLSAHS